jgi:hypothetical protein
LPQAWPNITYCNIYLSALSGPFDHNWRSETPAVHANHSGLNQSHRGQLQIAQSLVASMSAKYERLERQHQRLQPENQGVHQSEGVHNVKPNGPQGARVFCDNDVVIVGIGDGDAAAPRRYAVETAFEERLEKDEECARPRHLLRVDQLLAAPELARGNKEYVELRSKPHPLFDAGTGGITAARPNKYSRGG